MGLAFKDIPDEALPTLSSIALMVAGFIIVFADKNNRE